MLNEAIERVVNLTVCQLPQPTVGSKRRPRRQKFSRADLNLFDTGGRPILLSHDVLSISATPLCCHGGACPKARQSCPVAYVTFQTNRNHFVANTSQFSGKNHAHLAGGADYGDALTRSVDHILISIINSKDAPAILQRSQSLTSST